MDICRKNLPGSNKLPFERLIRFNLKDINSGELRIKLECMSDVWKIDALSIDYSDVQSMEAAEVPLQTGEVSGQRIEDKILRRDGNYQVLLPGDKIDLKFYDEYSTQNSRYFLNVAGYLYEWYVKKPNTNENFLSFMPQGISRLNFLKLMLNNKELLLYPMYYEWGKEKEKYN